VAFKEFAAAIPHLQEAIRMRNDYPEAHYNLARAYAALERFDDAIAEATIAERQALAANKGALVTQIREDLVRYRQPR